MMRPIARLAAFGLLLAAAGCGGNKLHPVRGQVVYQDGSPVKGLEGGQVVFEGTGPDGKKYSATGPLDAEGRFELGTEKPGDGAVAGKNRVLISPPTSEGDIPKPKVIDPKYETFERSGLEYEVKPGQKNEYRIKVDPAPKRR